MVAWQRQFGAAAPDVVCVNVSSRQFADVELAEPDRGDRCGRPACEPSRLKLEITESAFLGDIQAAQFTLAARAGDGHRVEPRRLRDRVFVVEPPAPAEGRHGEDRSFVCQPHRPRTTADRKWSAPSWRSRTTSAWTSWRKGSKRLEQLEYLRALGCEQAQGFFFSKPVTAAEAGSLIAAQPWRGLRGSASPCAESGTGNDIGQRAKGLVDREERIGLRA